MTSSGGLSNNRLRRMHDVMAGYVERGEAPGIVTAVSRGGEVHVDVIGNQDVGGPPMRRDTLFRITSMTKPITAVAAMILVEECRLRLDEPVNRLLPELADRRVLRSLESSLDDTVPADRPITLRDLLTFRLGWGIIMAPEGTYPIQQAISDLGLVGFSAPDPSAPHDPDEWLRRLGTLPLMHQPGEQWMYNTGSYVLGVLIARAAGQPLETFLRERIFEPLGMRDTSFSVPPEKRDRFGGSYVFNSASQALELVDGADGKWSRPPGFPDAGAGLVSTVDDLLAFSDMLLNNGRYGSTRILSRPAVEVMTTDQLTPEQKAASPSAAFILGNLGWGFGVGITTSRTSVSMVPGQYGWFGGYGTAWGVNPGEDMVGILLTQRQMGPGGMGISDDFWTLAYASIDD